nr:MAG TPA: hypothetical protein [Caudoviricetes sp.]
MHLFFIQYSLFISYSFLGVRLRTRTPYLLGTHCLANKFQTS